MFCRKGNVNCVEGGAVTDNMNFTYHFWAKTIEGGKPGISVFDHLYNVGCVARCIAEASPHLLDSFHLNASIVGALAALHDIGKISPGFQRKCQVWLEENELMKIDQNSCWDTAMEPDHGKVSHAAIQPFLMSQGFNRKTAKYVSAVLGGHHGRLNPPCDPSYSPQKAISENRSGINWDAERQGHAQRVWSTFTKNETGDIELIGTTPAIWWLAGLTTVADWIGSDEQFFSPERTATDESGKTIAKKALTNIGLYPPKIIKGLAFEDIFPFSPNEMQSQALATITDPGVYVIEAPMGIGKTEAALAVAYDLMQSGKANGIYFALPTQATSNRIHFRMNEFLQKISPDTGSQLIHGNSWLMEPSLHIQPTSTDWQGKSGDDARVGRNWFSSSKRSLIAPFGVGTVDQALLGVVAAKHFFVRHFALAGKVVILDEVHSYDLYTGTLIDKLIETLEGLGCTVIVLSATLTEQRREQIVPNMENAPVEFMKSYPLITGCKEGIQIKPVAIHLPESRDVVVEFRSSESAGKAAASVAHMGGTVLWICNTVDAAQKQFEQLTKMMDGKEVPVGLLHSRFPFWQREKLEDEWMERFGKDGKTRCGSILVATQVVEQSVDLDADLLVSELAPTDMLLQRIGRLWRHKERDIERPVDKARILIIEESKKLHELRNMNSQKIVQALGKKAWVYAPYILLRSLDVWKENTKISIPSKIRDLIEETYKARFDEPKSWQELSFEWLGTDSAKKMQARRNSNLWQVALEDVEGVQTRVNEVPTVALVLCRSISKQQAQFVDSSGAIFGDDVFRLKTAQAIHKNLVRIPQNCFLESCFNKSKKKLPFSEYLYDYHFIGLVSKGGLVVVEGLKAEVHLSYFDELGLVIEKESAKENI